MKKSLLIAGTAMLAMLSVPAMSADAAAGKVRAAVCAACHGPEGISNNPMWPNLKGQKAAYLVKQMKAFKDGTRSDPLMTPQSKALSDADMENLAAYYSSL